MRKNTSIMLSLIFFVIGIAFVFLFPMVNELIVGDQVEVHKATVLSCTQEYRKSFLVHRSGETRYTFTVTARLENGLEVTATENNSYQQREYPSGTQITLYGLNGNYKIDRRDLFAPWAGNSEIMYIVIIVIGALPIIVSEIRKKLS